MATERSALFLRGMPTRLVREAKAVAARRGQTLAAVVGDALARSLHDESGGAADAKELRDAMRWYEEHRARLLPRYRGQYVAIIERRVVDHARDFDALARRVFARWGVRPIFMPRVQEGDRLVRIRSPRVRR